MATMVHTQGLPQLDLCLCHVFLEIEIVTSLTDGWGVCSIVGAEVVL